jgi:hypothetical protein
MVGVRLVRRREILLPTVWGCALLLVLGAGGTVFVARNLYDFLATNDPAAARVLVVEGWLAPDELDQAVNYFRTGSYERVITTGGPIQSWPEVRSAYRSFAELAAAYLSAHGVPGDAIVAVPAPASAQERTFLSAVVVRDWAKRSGVTLDAIDVFSAGPHARRSRLLYRMAFGAGVEVGVLAARQRDYDPEAWWRTSSGAESVFGEAVMLTSVKLFFWPGPPGSHEELWAVPRPRSADDSDK